MRKIVQLMSVEDTLYALCDDGTVWVRVANIWRQVDTDGVERR